MSEDVTQVVDDRMTSMRGWVLVPVPEPEEPHMQGVGDLLDTESHRTDRHW